MDTIEINGEKYKKINGESDYFIVRTENAGVFAGEIEDKEGQEITMTDARRIWYWDGAASLSELAMKGTCKPENCKFPCAVDNITILGVIEIIECTSEAKDSIIAVKEWTASE